MGTTVAMILRTYLVWQDDGYPVLGSACLDELVPGFSTCLTLHQRLCLRQKVGKQNLQEEETIGTIALESLEQICLESSVLDPVTPMSRFSAPSSGGWGYL